VSPKKENRDKIVPVRLNETELEALDRRVSRTGLSRSALLRKDFLESQETLLELKKMVDKSVGR
jgi:predicted DNA binding CopG/RHH family protein